MANSANTFTGPLDGFFKEVYADKLENLVPEGQRLVKMIDFMSKEKSLGNLYH